jgi:streptomycin 6-kinase
MAADDPFTPWLVRWDLTPDGEPFATKYVSRLLPVRHDGQAAMLKLAGHEEERRGGILMDWWGGAGAARILAREGDALLMERVTGPRSLAAMAREGQDDEATAILCQVAAGLHAPRAATPPDSLVPLDRWFRSLRIAAARDGGPFAAALPTAEALLASPRDVVVLHGDLHHDNVLDGAERGWLAIDPKGLIGERGFEFANLFRTPDVEIALDPARLRARLAIVTKVAGLEPERLLDWIYAYATLGAAWSLESGHDPAPGLAIAQLARAERS